MPDARDVCLSMRGERNADALIASMAARLFGVAARRQLLTAGIDRNAIDRRIRRRVLQVIHGVCTRSVMPPLLPRVVGWQRFWQRVLVPL